MMNHRIITLLASLLLLSACSKQEETRGPKIDDPIVGKWFLDDDNQTDDRGWSVYVFRNDGTGASASRPYEDINISEFFYELSRIDTEFQRIAVFSSPTAPIGGSLGVFRIKGDIMEIFPYSGSTAPHYYYHRVTDWSETGLPEDIIEQLPE